MHEVASLKAVRERCCPESLWECVEFGGLKAEGTVCKQGLAVTESFPTRVRGNGSGTAYLDAGAEQSSRDGRRRE